MPPQIPNTVIRNGRKLYSMPYATRLLGVKKSWVYARVHTGSVPSENVNGYRMVTEQGMLTLTKLRKPGNGLEVVQKMQANIADVEKLSTT